MSHRLPSLTALTTFRSLLAAVGVALVLLLGAMAVNPALHALAHVDPEPCGHGHRHESAPTPATNHDHVCAVTLFAQGLALTTPVTIQPAAVAVWGEFALSAVEEPLLTAPRSRHAPPCGPPLV